MSGHIGGQLREVTSRFFSGLSENAVPGTKGHARPQLRKDTWRCCSGSELRAVLGIITGSVLTANVVAVNTASFNFFNIGDEIDNNSAFTASFAIF